MESSAGESSDFEARLERQQAVDKEQLKQQRNERLEARRQRIIDERKQMNRKYKPSPVKKVGRLPFKPRNDSQADHWSRRRKFDEEHDEWQASVDDDDDED